MNFLSFVQVLGRSWWVVGLALVVTMGSAAYFTYTQTPIYQASTTLVVGPGESLTDLSEITRSLRALDHRTIIATYARIPSSRTVRQKVRKQLGLSRSQMRVYRLRTTVLPDTNILRISVEGPDPRLAADVANAIAEETRTHAKEFYGIFGLKLLDPATWSSRPVRPEKQRTLAIGAVFGLLLGVGLVFFVEYIRQVRPAPREDVQPESKAELYTLRR